MLRFTRVISAVGLSVLLANDGAAQAGCPDPIPDTPTPSQLVECVRKFNADLDAVRSLMAIPSGAVLAFDTLSPTVPVECPRGWRSHRELRGRMIVGAGKHSNKDENGGNLSQYEMGETAGSEGHILSVSELPAHRHTGLTSGTNGHGNTSNAAQLGSGYQSPSFSIDTRDAVRSDRHPIQPHSHDVNVNGSPGLQGQSHNNMPPYLALLYCVKE